MSNVTEIKRDVARKTTSNAGEKAEPPNPLRCIAPGCPRLWSCDMGKGKLCAWHDAAPRLRWAEITDEIVALAARGLEPVYPELAKANWVAEASTRAKGGPRGEDLARAMAARSHDAMSAVEIARQKQNTQHMVDSLATLVDRR